MSSGNVVIKDCPIGLDVRGFLRSLADGDIRAAMSICRESIPFPGVMGSMCVAPCSRFFDRNMPLVSEFERFLLSDELDEFGRPVYNLRQREKTGYRVAVVGAGPSGLMAAHDLAMMGHNVEVYEREPKPGGMLDRAISSTRLPRHILFSEMDIFRKLDVRFNFGVIMGRNNPVGGLIGDFDAVYLAPGAYAFSSPVESRMKGNNWVNLFDFLDNFNVLKRRYSHFTILGSDNAAFHLAIRLTEEGRAVTIVSPKPIERMNVSQLHLDSAVKGRIELLFLHGLENVLLRGDEIFALELKRLAGDSVLNRILDDNIIQHETDFVILTKGRSPELTGISDLGLETDKHGFIVVDEHYMTNIHSVFAGGDAIDPDTDVLSSVTDGRLAAENIDRFIRGDGLAETKGMRKRKKAIRLSPGLDMNIPARGLIRDRASAIEQAGKILGSSQDDASSAGSDGRFSIEF